MTIYINDFYATIANVPNAFKPVAVVDYNPQITQGDVSNGVISRFFARQANQPKGQITEISPSVYGQLTSNPFWQVIEMDWRISGPLNDVTGAMTPTVPGAITANKMALQIANQEMPGMIYKVLNYVQYYFFSQSVAGDPPTFIIPTVTPQVSSGSGATLGVTQSFVPQQVATPQPVSIALPPVPAAPTRSMVVTVTQSTNIAQVAVVANAVVPQLPVLIVSSSISPVQSNTIVSIQPTVITLSSSIVGITVASQSHPAQNLTPVSMSALVASVSVVANAFIPTASVLEVSAIPTIQPITVANTNVATTTIVSSSIGGVAVQANAVVSGSTLVLSSSIGQAQAQSALPIPSSITLSPPSMSLINATPSGFTASIFNQFGAPFIGATTILWSAQFPQYVFVSASGNPIVVQALVGGQSSFVTAQISGTNVTASALVTTAAPFITNLLTTPTASVLYSASWGQYNITSASAVVIAVTAFDQYDNVAGCGFSSSNAQSLVVTPGNLLLSSSNPFQLTTRVTDTNGNPFNAQVSYQSSNPGVLFVTNTGLVTALAGNQTQSITVTVQGSSLTDIIQVLTTAAMPVSLSITPPQDTETTIGAQQPEFAITIDQYGQIYP